MHVLREESGVTVLRCYGELSLAVLDLTRVRHLHYAGARLLREVPGLRLAGASRYLRDLVLAGGGFGVEFHPDVADAMRAG
jgi:hypothetical protein